MPCHPINMEIDLMGKDAAKAYTVLAGIVTPRPIALVTTIDENVVVNAAPFSFFNVFGADPPLVGFAPGDRPDGTPKDTARNIRFAGEFVINLVDEEIAEKMNLCAASLPPGMSEVTHAGFTTIASSMVKPPRLAEAPFALECKEWDTLQIGDNRLVIGIVHRVHARDGLIDPKTLYVNGDDYRPVGRMQAPNWYCRSGDRFEMVRPR